MAYQFSAILFESSGQQIDAKTLLERVGFPDGVSAGYTTFVEAINPILGTRTVGSTDSWTMMTDSSGFISVKMTAPFGQMWSPYVQKTLTSVTADGTRAFAFIFSPLSKSFGFSEFANGTHLRSKMVSLGRVSTDSGDPFPEEAEAFQEEQGDRAILKLMELRGIPFRAFEQMPFEVFTYGSRF